MRGKGESDSTWSIHVLVGEVDACAGTTEAHAYRQRKFAAREFVLTVSLIGFCGCVYLAVRTLRAERGSGVQLAAGLGLTELPYYLCIERRTDQRGTTTTKVRKVDGQEMLTSTKISARLPSPQQTDGGRLRVT